MTRVAQTEILCVYCAEGTRAHLRAELAHFHPEAVHTTHRSGWIVVEQPLGEPHSRYLGSPKDVRFLLGEEDLTAARPDALALDRLADRALHDAATLGQLPGDFSFVVLAANGRAAAVRSCCGNPRLFGFCRDGVTAVSTRLDWLARVYPKPLALDRMRIAIDLSGLSLAPRFASALEGINAVPCGHVAEWSRWDNPRVTSYWSLPERIELYRAGEVVEVIESELCSELRRHVDSRTNAAVLLSGGLDSSLLAALASKETKTLDAVTTLPPQEHPEFERERRFSRLAARGCRDHVHFTFTAHTLVEHLRAAPGDLCPLGMEWFGLSALPKPPEVVISGWFADECWGFLRLAECLAPWLPNIPRLAVHAPFKRQLFKFWIDRHRSGRFTFPPANVAYPAVLDSRFAQEFRGWLTRAAWIPRPEAVAEKLRLHRSLTDMGGLYAEAASYFGARAIAPFAGRRLVELAAKTDPHLLFHLGRSKAPLRILAKRLLPSALALRSDKGDWAPLTRGVETLKPNLAGIQALLDTSYVADHPSLSLDDLWSIEWLSVLERGRSRVEHERKSIWR